MSDIRILDVDESLAEVFLAYAAAYGGQHDDTYLTREALARFDLAHEPAAIAMDSGNAVVGAASVMLDPDADEGSARFRVAHTLYPEYYPALVDRVIARVPAAISHVFLLLPERAGDAEEALGAIGFGVCNRAYVLRHTDPRGVPRLDYPSETHIQVATAAVAKDWAHVVNAAFRGASERCDLTQDRAAEILSSSRVLREATLVAYRGGVPAGVVMTTVDATDACAAEIQTLAVTPTQQGMGVGRSLLHDAVAAVGRHGCRWVTIAVSALNRRAVALYLDAGFQAEDIRVCWERRLG